MSASHERAGRRRAPHVLVVGLGNELCGDDGVGVHVVRWLERTGALPTRTDLQVAEVGIAVLDALHLWEWADRILAIDAMQAGGEPGSVYLAHLADLQSGDPAPGLHGVNLADALRLHPNQRWDDVLVLGIEPATLALGLDLSPQVQAAVRSAATRTAQVVDQWLAT